MVRHCVNGVIYRNTMATIVHNNECISISFMILFYFTHRIHHHKGNLFGASIDFCVYISIIEFVSVFERSNQLSSVFKNFWYVDYVMKFWIFPECIVVYIAN